MKNQLRLTKRQLITAIAELSEQITNQQQVASLIVPESSYQVIPGFVQSYIHHTDNIIKWFLPYSKSRLIQITLPFTYLGNNLQQTRVLGKYILFGCKLRGIRISSRSKCASEIPKSMSPSPMFQQYYKQNGISYCQNQILIGDFYLQLMNCRVGLFFEDELFDFASFKNLCEKYRFDIISVMSNIQKKIGKDDSMLKSSYQQKEIQQKLKIISKENKVTVLFAGMKIVPNTRIVYLEKSFIMQDNNSVIMPKNIFGKKNFIAIVADIELTLQKKWRNYQNTQIIEEQNQKNLQKLEINMILKQNQILPNPPVLTFDAKRPLNDFYGQKQLMVYNLWYIYKTINKNSPFVIPFPFSNRRQKLFSYLMNLSQHCNKQIDQLAKVYRYKIDSSVSKYQLKVYDSFQQMLTNNSQYFSELIYLYCEEQDQTKRLRNNQVYSHRICNCQSLIPNSINQAIQVQHNEIIVSKKIEYACNYVLKERLQNIQQILNYFWDQQLSKKQIQKCFTQILPNKVKKFFKLTPHYLFLLQSTPQEIIEQIGQAEIRLKSRGKSKVLVEENESQYFPKRLVQRIQATRKYKNNLNLLFKCHRCNFRLKKDLLFNCAKCSNMLCFDCIDIITNHSLFELNQYKCAICLKICKCSKCQITPHVQVEKIAKPMSQEQSFRLKFVECAKCYLLDSCYDKIQIECTQCKNMRCYNCAKAQKSFQISKIDSWICKDCIQFNEEIMNKIQRANQIEISLDENDMNQQIIEESISRSPSPFKEVENNEQINMNPLKNQSEENFTLKSLQRDNDVKLEDYQILDKQIIQQSKEDKLYQNNKQFEKNLQQQQYRFVNDRKRKQMEKQRSRSRHRNKSKEKDRYRSCSSSSQRSHRKSQNRKKRSKKLWSSDKKEKERQIEKQVNRKKQRSPRNSNSMQKLQDQQNHNKNTNKLWDLKKKGQEIKKENQETNKNRNKFEESQQKKDRQLNKTNKSSLWKKQKKKSSSQQNSRPSNNKVVPSKRTGLIFQTNIKKEIIPDSQQQSY